MTRTPTKTSTSITPDVSGTAAPEGHNLQSMLDLENNSSSRKSSPLPKASKTRSVPLKQVLIDMYGASTLDELFQKCPSALSSTLIGLTQGTDASIPDNLLIHFHETIDA